MTVKIIKTSTNINVELTPFDYYKIFVVVGWIMLAYLHWRDQ